MNMIESFSFRPLLTRNISYHNLMKQAFETTINGFRPLLTRIISYQGR